MEKLKTIELKFLLKLLEKKAHRGHISELKPNCKTSAAKCDRLCRTLAEQGLVDYDTEIFRFTLTPPGRVLLTLQTTSLPVTPDELKLLKACKGSMTLEKLGNCVPPGYGQQLVRNLVNRKLLKVTRQQITEVWLTEAGKQFSYVAEEGSAFAKKSKRSVVLPAKL
ncbi:MAG: hypothetical protein AAGN15_15690 [Cyanobacteria bacterium J06581_3]